MKPKENKEYVRRVLRKSKLSIALHQILVASFGVGFSLLAWGNTADETSGEIKKVKFNSGFMHGGGVDVSRFAEGNPTPAGKYPVKVTVNNESRGQHTVLFKAEEGSASARPCFTASELSELGIKYSTNPQQPVKQGADADEQCTTIEQWVAGSNANYTAGDFHLELTVPQAYLVHFPRGYTDPRSWDSGVTAAILDYNSNFYVQRNSGHAGSSDSHTSSGNLGLLTGFNFFDWRLRKRINTSWTSGDSAHTQSLYTYLQRDITPLKSQLTLGDSTTSGDLFDSLTVRGIQLQSDNRMLPEELRYYTPLVRGIAETNAKVLVTQRGRTLYETTVPPGPFELNDIGAMGYGGDLQLTITEADGRQRTQVVPYSAPPMLLHQGVSRFGITVGKVKDSALVEEPSLAQGFYQYGLGNMYTLYGGGQLSENYTALGVGNAFNTPLGGISMDVTRARSQLANGKTSSGNSYNVGYSKYLETTDTDVNIAAWRYSSKGFYSLRDATLERYGSKNEDYIVDYRTRQRFTVSLNQALWTGARLSLSGNYYTYWNDRSATRQYMLTYSQSQRYFSWSLSASRSLNDDGHDVNSVMFSISVPLGRSNMIDKPLFSSLYSTASHDNDGGSAFQMNAIGSQGEQSALTYGVGTAVSKTRGDSTNTAFNGNVNYNSSFGQFGSTASVGNQSSQLSLSANGSLVAHSGGITIGPRLGDYPFALVEAQGAEGAHMLNGYGSEIDSNGFAIVPSLTPYRKNTVAVNTRGLPDTVDVLESESTVIPRMGAAVKVNVKTQVGAPVVLIIKNAQGKPLPIGADIYDANNSSLGIIGQGGMAFVRGWQADKSNLYVKNSSGQQLCIINSDSSIASKLSSAQGSIIQVEVLCH